MGRARYAAVTLAPLTWLVAVTFSASYYKIFDPNPRIGFLAHTRQLAASAAGSASAPVGTARLIFNDHLDAAVTGILIVMVAMILIESAAEWIRILAGRKQPVVRESPFVATRFVTEEQA